MKNFHTALCIALTFNTSKVFGSEAGMPQLNKEFWTSQIFWLILIFSSLYIIIWKVFLPKIANNIENRKLRIVNDLNEAQKLKENSEKKLKDYNTIIENTKKKAKQIVEDSKKKLNNEIKNKKQNFNKEIEKELLDIEKEIKNLKNTSLSNITKISVEISSELIKQMVKSEINTSNVEAIVGNIAKQKMEKNL